MVDAKSRDDWGDQKRGGWDVPRWKNQINRGRVSVGLILEKKKETQRLASNVAHSSPLRSSPLPIAPHAWLKWRAWLIVYHSDYSTLLGSFGLFLVVSPCRQRDKLY